MRLPCNRRGKTEIVDRRIVNHHPVALGVHARCDRSDEVVPVTGIGVGAHGDALGRVEQVAEPGMKPAGVLNSNVRPLLRKGQAQIRSSILITPARV